MNIEFFTNELGQSCWLVHMSTTTYVVGVNRLGQVVHSYWGLTLPRPSDYPPLPEEEGYASFNGASQMNPEEYPAFGGLAFVESCLKAQFSDGARDVRLRYAHFSLHKDASVQELVITLVDDVYDLHVNLHYRVTKDTDVLERFASIENKSEQPCELVRIFSAQWHLPAGKPYRLTHITGKWFDEWHKVTEPLTKGVKVLESRRMTSSHHHHPTLFLSLPSTTLTQGDCWFAALAWSGNWKFTAEVTDFDQTRCAIGWNDWDFCYRLHAGQRVVTPSVFLGYTDKGFTAASHALHDYVRQMLPHADLVRPVLFNGWEVSGFDVREREQMTYAEHVAELGVELFVVDDGWFHGRTFDNRGLGDWWADEQKFPNGLAPLIEHVNRLGMDFGIWIEPEMVNPDSELYRQHPEWALRNPKRQPILARNQLMLNMAREDVQTYLIEQFDALLSQHNIQFVKWDMNRNVAEVFWETTQHAPQEIWVRYVEGMYHVWRTLKERHPHVIWQSCSGGGGRADVGMFRLADQVWLSDNTDPVARLSMQAHYLQLYPASTMESWVTHMGDTFLPLKFRFHVSMCGVLGIGANVMRWTASERATAQALIKQYKQIRTIVQHGLVYFLHLPHAQDSDCALQYMARNGKEGVIFVFRVQKAVPAAPLRIHLQGLDPTAMYTVEGYGTKSGLAWERTPLAIPLANYDSQIIAITRKE